MCTSLYPYAIARKGTPFGAKSDEKANDEVRIPLIAYPDPCTTLERWRLHLIGMRSQDVRLRMRFHFSPPRDAKSRLSFEKATGTMFN